MITAKQKIFTLDLVETLAADSVINTDVSKIKFETNESKCSFTVVSESGEVYEISVKRV